LAFGLGVTAGPGTGPPLEVGLGAALDVVGLGAALDVVGLDVGLDVGLAVTLDVGLDVAIAEAAKAVTCAGPKGARASAAVRMRPTETAGYATTALTLMRWAGTLFMSFTRSSLVGLVVG
jgi:hypothetical protein